MTPLAAPVSSVSERTEKQGDVVVGRCIFDLKHNLKCLIINICWNLMNGKTDEFKTSTNRCGIITCKVPHYMILIQT